MVSYTGKASSLAFPLRLCLSLLLFQILVQFFRSQSTKDIRYQRVTFVQGVHHAPARAMLLLSSYVNGSRTAVIFRHESAPTPSNKASNNSPPHILILLVPRRLSERHNDHRPCLRIMNTFPSLVTAAVLGTRSPYSWLLPEARGDPFGLSIRRFYCIVRYF